MERADRRLTAAITLAVFVVLAPGAFFGVPGKSVAGAWRLLQGELPYRDWWTMYAPGQFYAVGALLAVSAKQVLAPALAAGAVRAVTSGLLFAFARDVGANRAVASVLALLLGASRFEIAPELSSYPLAFAFIAWALFDTVRYVRGEGRARLVLAGCSLGIAAFFKHDVAGYAAVSIAVGLAGAWWLAGGRRPASWQPPTRALLSLLAPAAALVGVIAVWLAVAAGRDAWQDLIAFPLGDFRLVRAEPYPPIVPRNPALLAWLSDPSQLAKARDAAEALEAWILAHAPEAAFLAGIAFVARTRRSLAPEKLAAVCVLLAMVPIHWWAAHTQQNTHFTTMAVASFLVGTIMWTEAPRARWGIGALAALWTCGLAIKPASDLYLVARVWSEPVELGLPATRGIRVSPRERELYRDVAELVRERVPPDEPMYAGVARHDAIVINNPRFAWLCDRRAATRYHELHPGLTDRADVQREMIADLEREHVSCAVIWNFGWPEVSLDAILARRTAAIPACGATLLDQYFAEHFEPVLERGEYTVLWRKRAEPPKLR